MSSCPTAAARSRSDDPEHVWFARRSGTWSYNAILPEYQLTVYDRETGELYERTSRSRSLPTM